MRVLILASVLSAFPHFTLAAPGQSTIDAIVRQHILPGFTVLADATEVLKANATGGCDVSNVALRDAYGAAFDAWVAVSHLRFGPTEFDNRVFSLAFWPDPRGATPSELAQLIAAQDPIVGDPEAFPTVSIAGRGFYALEFLLYDAQLSQSDPEEYRCALVAAIATDIDQTADAILDDWQSRYAALMATAGENETYQSDEEALQELFKALMTGLEFTADTRLGRPLGTFDKPRPKRAEVWRSGRSLRHVALSLEATRELAHLLSADNKSVSGELETAFDRASDRVAEIAAIDGGTDFSAINDLAHRFKLELLQQDIASIRRVADGQLGPLLGVSAGFNALDGD